MRATAYREGSEHEVRVSVIRKAGTSPSEKLASSAESAFGQQPYRQAIGTKVPHWSYLVGSF